MAILTKTWGAGLMAAAISGFLPLGASAQDVAGNDATGVFAFSGYGSTAVDDLPFELAPSPETPAPLPQLRATNLRMAAAAHVTQKSEAERTINPNIWAIGVYR